MASEEQQRNAQIAKLTALEQENARLRELSVTACNGLRERDYRTRMKVLDAVEAALRGQEPSSDGE